MTYDVFVCTLLARMGLPFEKADAGAARDGVDRLVRLSAMVDDLLADAGYDTLFDTREKGLEALRQDIKVKLGTAPPVDRETLATRLAEAAMPGMSGVLNRDFWLRAADAALRLISAESVPGAERKKWPELKAEVESLKQQSIDLRFKIARLLGLGLNLPSAEALLKGLEARLKELNGHIRTHELTISLLGKIIRGHANPDAVLRDAETGEVAHIAPDVQRALSELIRRVKTAEPEVEKLKTTNGQLAAERNDYAAELVAARKKLADMHRERERVLADQHDLRLKLQRELLSKPLSPVIDRDRIRLALLDYTENHAYAHLINELADHLVERLKS